MYSIVWKYKVNEENQTEFESEYGYLGTWSKLFMSSDNYKGSFLHKSPDMNLTYLLIDTWTDEQSYEDFKSVNGSIYESLSSGFEKLYEKEEKIGAFNTVNSTNVPKKTTDF